MTTPNRRRRQASPASSPLPPLYEAWVLEAVGELPPNETTATCMSCAMLPPPDLPPEAAAGGLFFDPRTKCCTYIPELPNFLVGRILLDLAPDAAEGRASVRARIQDSPNVTPLGIEKPPEFAILYSAGASELFGRATSLRCPHYLADSGGCGVYRHRMSTCCTWFCKHDRGSNSRVAWDALRQLLRVVERVVAVHCVRTLAPGSVALHQAMKASPTREPRLRAADLGGLHDPEARRQAWGSYAGREEAFFEACGRIASRLTWKQVAALGGVELALALDVVGNTRRAADDTRIPRAVRVGQFTVGYAGADSVECTTDNSYDPLSIPRALFDRLHLFDGRTTRKALAALEADGVSIGPRVVRKLVDHGFLVDASK